MVTKFPETEKTLSLFAELAGTARTAFANPSRSGEGRKRKTSPGLGTDPRSGLGFSVETNSG